MVDQLFKGQERGEVLRKAAIAAALIPVVDRLGKARPDDSGEALMAMDEMIRDFERDLHSVGFEIIQCPAQSDEQILGAMHEVIVGFENEATPGASEQVH